MATRKATGNKIQTLPAKAIARAEREAGISVSALEDPNALGKVDLLIELAYEVHKREANPAMPKAAFEEQYTIEQIVALLGLND